MRKKTRAIWAVVKTGFKTRGVFDVVRGNKEYFDLLPSFFGPDADDAFNEGTPTVINVYRSRKEALGLLKSVAPRIESGLWRLFRRKLL